MTHSLQIKDVDLCFFDEKLLSIIIYVFVGMLASGYL